MKTDTPQTTIDTPGSRHFLKCGRLRAVKVGLLLHILFYKCWLIIIKLTVENLGGKVRKP